MCSLSQPGTCNILLFYVGLIIKAGANTKTAAQCLELLALLSTADNWADNYANLLVKRLHALVATNSTSTTGKMCCVGSECSAFALTIANLSKLIA